MTIIDTFKKGDHQILAMHKKTIDRIYARIKERIERAHAFGFAIVLSPADEHDIAWVDNELKEMQAYYAHFDIEYLQQLKYNFKWRAIGHGALAIISAIFASWCGYVCYYEWPDLTKHS